jgi:DNA invertase Pin-like site-specific DNA recombinase
MYFDPTYDSNQQPIRTKGKAMRKIYYGRISTTDGQTSASQYADAEAHGIDKSDVFIDEGVSGYHVAPMDRPQWQHVYKNRREMQKRGIEVAKKEGAYAGVGRKRAADYAEVRAWRAENGASIAQTAEQFGISAASVKRALREKGAAEQLNGEQQ